MSTKSLRQLCLLGALWVLLGHAAQAQDAGAGMALQGRKNPFRPLVVPRQGLPEVPLAPVVPRRIERPVVSGLSALEYVGIAFDEAEAVAAVRYEGKLMFVRKGDRLDGATVQSITPHKLIWRQQARTIVKHLRRSSGAH